MTISLKSESAYSDGWKPGTTAEGLTVTSTPYSFEMRDGTTHSGESHDFVWPELGARRCFRKMPRGGVVAPIGGRMYRIFFEADGGEDNIPESAQVTFIETTDAETPFEAWDETEVLAQHRKGIVDALDVDREMLADDPKADYLTEFIERQEKELARLDAGELKFRPTHDLVLFGQPDFIQNSCAPVHEGRAAACLAVLNTGWGDSGNINLMVSLDGDGRPCRLWFEASCC